MAKKLFVVAAAALMLSLSACNSGSTPMPTNPPVTTSASASPSATVPSDLKTDEDGKTYGNSLPGYSQAVADKIAAKGWDPTLTRYYGPDPEKISRKIYIVYAPAVCGQVGYTVVDDDAGGFKSLFYGRSNPRPQDTDKCTA